MHFISHPTLSIDLCHLSHKEYWLISINNIFSSIKFKKYMLLCFTKLSITNVFTVFTQTGVCILMVQYIDSYFVHWLQWTLLQVTWRIWLWGCIKIIKGHLMDHYLLWLWLYYLLTGMTHLKLLNLLELLNDAFKNIVTLKAILNNIELRGSVMLETAQARVRQT